MVNSAEGLAVACTLGYLITLSFNPYSLFSLSPVEGAALTVSQLSPEGSEGSHHSALLDRITLALWVKLQAAVCSLTKGCVAMQLWGQLGEFYADL